MNDKNLEKQKQKVFKTIQSHNLEQSAKILKVSRYTLYEFLKKNSVDTKQLRIERQKNKIKALALLIPVNALKVNKEELTRHYYNNLKHYYNLKEEKKEKDRILKLKVENLQNQGYTIYAISKILNLGQAMLYKKNKKWQKTTL